MKYILSKSEFIKESNEYIDSICMKYGIQRYLKKFNESHNADSLLELCENQLAFLIDEGYYVKVRNDFNEYRISIRLKKEGSGLSGLGTFNFNEIKEEFIALYELLKEKYELVDYYRSNGNHHSYIEIITFEGENYVPTYIDTDTSEEIVVYREDYKDILCISVKVKEDSL